MGSGDTNKLILQAHKLTREIKGKEKIHYSQW